MGVGNSLDDALRLFRFAHAKAAVHAGDHQIEALQHVFWIIKRTISQNVGLDPLENPESAVRTCVQLIHLLLLSQHLIRLQATSVVRRLGTVGQPQIP